jgi:cytoskeletal protein RodZ
MNKIKWFGLILIFILIAGGIYLSRKINTPQSLPVNQTVSINQENSQTQSPEATSSSTSTNLEVQNSATPVAPAVSGETRGQIICDYQTPPDPTHYGTANIESNWNNTAVDVCVSSNGGVETLIASDSKTNGSRTDRANWIGLNADYTFTLFNERPGNSVCGGGVLSTCRIHTPEYTNSSPQPNTH